MQKRYILIVLVFIGLSCADNASSPKVKVRMFDTTCVSKDTQRSEQHVVDSEELIKQKQSKSLLSFEYKSSMYTKNDKAKGVRNAVPFYVESKKITGDTLTVVLEGIQGAGGFKGNVEVNGNEIKLYYWYDEDVEMVHHREHYNLSYLIKLPEVGKDYSVQVVEL